MPLTITPVDTYDFSEDVITAADLDGDGRQELKIRRDIGHPNNSGYDVWYYDLATRSLRMDSVLSAETNLRADSIGCVCSSAWLGGMHTIERRLCHAADRRWLVVWQRVQKPDSDGALVSREYQFVNGNARLIAQDTISNVP